MKACPFCYQLFPEDVGFCPFHGAELRDVIDWEPAAREGTEVDGYKLEKCVGTDALGEVFRAHKGKQQFHVRLFYPHVVVDGMRVIRMLDDFERLKAAKHPALVRIVKADKLQDGTVFAVREWLEGESLREVVKRRVHLEPSEAAPIVRLVLDGLKALHKLDLVHGYLSPESVFIERASNGKTTVRLVDAALWRVHQVDNPNEVAGENTEFYAKTADYMAPEAIEGKEPRQGADIYSAGILFFELLTGRTPFASPSATATFKRHLAEDPVPATLARPDLVLPDGLQDLIATALAKTPDTRFATAEAFRNALTVVVPTSRDEDDGYLPGEVLPTRELTLQKKDRPSNSSAAAVVAKAAEVSAAKAAASANKGESSKASADVSSDVAAVVDAEAPEGRGRKKGKKAKGGKGGKADERTTEGADGSLKRGEKDSAAKIEAVPPAKAEPTEPGTQETARTEPSKPEADAAKSSSEPDKTEPGAPDTKREGDVKGAGKKPDEATPVADEPKGKSSAGKKAEPSKKTDGRGKGKGAEALEEGIDLDEDEGGGDAWFSATGGDDLSHTAMDYEAEQYARRSSRVTTYVVVGAVIAVAAIFVLWVGTSDDGAVDEEALAAQQEAADREAKKQQRLAQFEAAVNLGDFTGPESAYAHLIELRRMCEDQEFESLRQRFLGAGRKAAEEAQAGAAEPVGYFDDYTLVEVKRKAAGLLPAPDSGAPALGARGEALLSTTYGFVHGTLGRVATAEQTRSHFEAWTQASVIWGRLSELAGNPQDEELFRGHSARASRNARFFEDRTFGEPSPPPTEDAKAPKTGQADTGDAGHDVVANAGTAGPPASAAQAALDAAAGATGDAAATGAPAEPAAAIEQPAVTEPAQPAVTEPVQPAATEPVQPAATEPAQPTVTEPTKPAEPAPATVNEPAPADKPADKPATEPKESPKTDTATDKTATTKPADEKKPEAKAESASKADAEALTEQGFAALNAGKLKEAKDAFDAALKAKSGHPRALFGLAEVAWDENDFQRSAEYYLKASEKAPSNAAYRIKLGNSYIKLQRYQDALEAYETAESVARDDKTREHAQKGIAIAKRKLGQ